MNWNKQNVYFMVNIKSWYEETDFSNLVGMTIDIATESIGNNNKIH